MSRKVWVIGLLALAQASAAVSVRNLMVEYRDTPLGIDVAQPRFGWQLAATAGERGLEQAAYQIVVRDSKGGLAWDSGKVADSASVGVRYGGAALKGATRYGWNVSVWTTAGKKLAADSWFETGLMDSAPDSPAWGGAKWIGGGNQDLVLYAPYLAIFTLKYTVTIPARSTKASLVYGANDSRLMDANKNIYQLAMGKDESYIRLELDVAATPKLNVYRAGYKPGDRPGVPLKSFDIPADVINDTNRNTGHTLQVKSAFGQIAVSIDGKTNFVVNLNPMGQGGNYLPFGLLCDLGFAAEPGQTAIFRDVAVMNHRAPNNVLFQEDLDGGYRGLFAGTEGLEVRNGAYVVTGGSKGMFVARDPSRNSMPMLRTVFKARDKAVDAARLYVTARGIYEVFLNGKRVGNDYYNPGLTQYNITHMYQTYDVTDMVKAGENALGAMLGEGWWSGLLSFGTIWNHFGDRQSLLAKLVVSYKDGTQDTVVTDDRTWKYFGAGPVIYSSLDFGEIYDAGRERAVEGWSAAGYDDRNWKRAAVVPLEGTAFAGTEIGFGGRPSTPLLWDKLAIVAQVGSNAGIFKTLTARSVKDVRPGVFVYDMGQNMVGVPRVRIADGRAGAKITLRFAEIMYPDLPESGKNTGMIMMENYRAALSTDRYTMKAGPQVFQPRFTSHGYQFVEITGIEKPLPLEAVEGVVISSVRELTADYRTSVEKVNKLWSNLVWSNVDNFLSIPTDCPQRNERMGWSGDLNVFSRTATYVSNADQFLTRHMYAMRDVQSANGRFADIAPVGGGFGGVLWGSAGIVVPWETYLQYNDVGVLERNYAAMAAYMSYLEGQIDSKTGLLADSQLGDWLGPQNNALGSPFLATAYHAYDLEIMSKVAGVLGKKEDAARYREMYEKRKAYFNKTFVNAEGKTLATGSGGFGGPRQPAGPPVFRVGDTQTSYAVGLAMGLFDRVPEMVRNLAECVRRQNRDDSGKMRPMNSLMTGFIGTSWISKALSDHGQSELAYRLLLNNQYPSWLYAIDQGATTIWERLNGYTVENGFGGNNSMNSFNHYSFGAVGQWMMAYSLGIQRGEPGFKRFVLQPEPDPTGTMTWAEGHYDSMYGRIESKWKLEAGTLTYRAVVPPNTTATLYLPVKQARGGKGAKFVKSENGRAVYELVSGAYEFTGSR